MIKFSIIFLLLSISVFAQNYSDVAVLINSNSLISRQVGEYFAYKRSIPSNNLIYLSMDTTDEITGSQCTTYYDSIKTILTNRSLTSSINYIVTTQGVPLKTRRAGSVFSSTSDASSFDSDLCLVGSTSEASIGNNGSVTNPYAFVSAYFTRSATYNDIRLVTRLAGYTFSGIQKMIDSSSNFISRPASSGTFYYDLDITKGGNILNQNLISARNTTRSRGYNTLLDSTTLYLTNKNDAIYYTSWGSNDASWSSYSDSAKPNFKWTARSIGYFYSSSSARSFSDTCFIESSIGWQTPLVELLHGNNQDMEGPSGTYGPVWEPYSTAMLDASYLTERWTSPLAYNFAEAVYMSLPHLGWMNVVVGDPKMLFNGVQPSTDSTWPLRQRTVGYAIDASASTTRLNTFPNPTLRGNTIVVAFAIDNDGSATAPTCADSVGNTYTRVAHLTVGGSANNTSVSIFVAKNCYVLPSDRSVTITHASRNDKAGIMAEFQNVDSLYVFADTTRRMGSDVSMPISIDTVGMGIVDSVLVIYAVATECDWNSSAIGRIPSAQLDTLGSCGTEGTSAASQTLFVEYKKMPKSALTFTGNMTIGGVTARDYAAAIVSLRLDPRKKYKRLTSF